MCLCDGDGGEKEKERESYQSCCQSPGQVVIREAVWQWLVSASTSLSLTLTCAHTYNGGEKTLLCSPLPPMSEHSTGVLGWGVGLYGSHLSTVFCGSEMTENTDGKTWGKLLQKKGFTYCSCGSSV